MSAETVGNFPLSVDELRERGLHERVLTQAMLGNGQLVRDERTGIVTREKLHAYRWTADGYPVVLMSCKALPAMDHSKCGKPREEPPAKAD